MKPRYEETSSEVHELFAKAVAFEKRLDDFAKAECPTCGMKKADCMKKYGSGCGMKKADIGEKDKYCMKNFGKKYSECSDKQKAQCDKAHSKVEKGEHHKAATFGTKPEIAQFHIETGGNTYHQGYQTNQSLLEVDDIANKGATSSSVNLDALSREQNTHDKNTGHFSFAGE